VYVLTWNLFHGRAAPAAGRPLLREFATTLAALEWDVALLQEVPPWWPATLAFAAGADHASALTSRNSLLPLRRAIGKRNPDLIASAGGGANAILVRGREIAEHRVLELTREPERRVAHAVRLPEGWVVNLHASKDPKDRTRADVAKALAWAPEPLLAFGGDLNLSRPDVPGLVHAGGHHVDHLYGEGGDPEVLDAGTLSDHRPLRVSLAAGRSRAA
jgi:endonuclease/exonuclease/phosphatase family metal-dependent hydrolase